ncbi:DUF5681 domain-containing protein [Methylocystis sp.]|uniref:DUF5681 domain-containing protein n=1 Tax=Methylocystis sp. TaxID=1911079 RepID=UPI0025D04164|nr:DUF5681 domain-containing protein [Methylocystis sp.]
MPRAHKQLKLPHPEQSAASYDVGCAKPPASTKFKPGQSGNPRGRPKGSRNKPPRLNEERLKDIIIAEAYRAIKINEGDKKVSIPMAQAIVRSLAVNAAKGQHRAQQLFAELLTMTERANKALHDEYLQTVIEYKVDWERELERRRTFDINAPDPIPHPDDIVIELKTGEVKINGPMTKEEKVVWDSLRQRLEDCHAEIEELQKLAADPESESYRHIIEGEIAFETKLRDRIANTVGEKPHASRRRQ